MACFCFRWDRDCDKCHDEALKAGYYGENIYEIPEDVTTPKEIATWEYL